MTQYYWELGINWDAVYDNGKAFLQTNLVEADQLAPPIFDAQQGPVSLGFRIYDTTLPDGPPQQDQQISSLKLTTRSADRNQVGSSPFSGSIHAITAWTPVASLYSVVFEKDLPGWQTTSFYNATNPGRFLVTLQVRATNHSVSPALTLDFRVDPEMIVEDISNPPLSVGRGANS